MKKIVSSALALLLCLCLATPSALAAASPWIGHTSPMLGPGGTTVVRAWSNEHTAFNNFKRVREYTPDAFSGVPQGAWYGESLRCLYELGLIDGGAFDPNGRLTLAEVLSLAVRVHRTYNGWSVAMSDLQYALNTGIVENGQYDDYSAPATRRSFAAIMAKTLPSEGLRGMNVVMDNAIPDVPLTDPGAGGIYTLYRAGVLLGGDVRGTFSPDSMITRAAAAVAAARIVVPSQRQGISLLTADSYGLTLSRTSLNMIPGDVKTLTATVFPVNSTERGVDWASSEPRTATVDENGTVTALRPGNVLIIATSAAGATATCSIRVSEPTRDYPMTHTN